MPGKWSEETEPRPWRAGPWESQPSTPWTNPRPAPRPMTPQELDELMRTLRDKGLAWPDPPSRDLPTEAQVKEYERIRRELEAARAFAQGGGSNAHPSVGEVQQSPLLRTIERLRLQMENLRAENQTLRNLRERTLRDQEKGRVNPPVPFQGVITVFEWDGGEPDDVPQVSDITRVYRNVDDALAHMPSHGRAELWDFFIGDEYDCPGSRRFIWNPEESRWDAPAAPDWAQVHEEVGEGEEL